jgi:hypothetical protein
MKHRPLIQCIAFSPITSGVSCDQSEKQVRY